MKYLGKSYNVCNKHLNHSKKKKDAVAELGTVVKTLLRICISHIRAPKFKSWFQLSTNESPVAWKLMAQVLGSLPPSGRPK